MSLGVGEFRDAQELKAFKLGGLKIGAWIMGSKVHEIEMRMEHPKEPATK